MRSASLQWTTLLLTACLSASAGAQDREDHTWMATDRYVELFQWADRDRNKAVSRAESSGSVVLEASVDDIDINRNGHITWLELERYSFTVLNPRRPAR